MTETTEPLHVPVPMWLSEEALEHYRELVLAIGAVWVSGEWWLPFYVKGKLEVFMPVSMWLLERRAAADSLISQKEISTMAEEQKSGPVNLDDTQVIEKGPEVKASEALSGEDLDKDRMRKEAMAAAAAAGIKEVSPESAHGEEAFKNAAAAAGINTPCKGCPDPETEVVDGIADAKPPAPLGRDHAQGRPQTGIATDPDPVAPGSGLRASRIAKIAYDAVQGYKETIGQKPTWFCYLLPEVKDRITFMVAEFLRGRGAGAAKVHEMWKADQLAAGITVEQDPRLGQAWLEMDPSECRKGLIFQVMLNSLVRPF